MSATDFIKTAFRSSLDSLGAEPVEIEGQRTNAVVGELTAMEDLELGASGDMRTLTLVYPTTELPETPRKGGSVTARGQQWIINHLDTHPETTTRLVLHSPSRFTT